MIVVVVIFFWPLVGPCMCPSISFPQLTPLCTATECSIAGQQQLNATKKEYPIGEDENLPLSVDSLRRPVSTNELPRTFIFYEVWAWSFHHHHPSLPLLGVCEQPPHSDTLTSGSKTKGLDLMYSR